MRSLSLPLSVAPILCSKHCWASHARTQQRPPISVVIARVERGLRRPGLPPSLSLSVAPWHGHTASSPLADPPTYVHLRERQRVKKSLLSTDQSCLGGVSTQRPPGKPRSGRGERGNRRRKREREREERASRGLMQEALRRRRRRHGSRAQMPPRPPRPQPLPPPRPRGRALVCSDECLKVMAR